LACAVAPAKDANTKPVTAIDFEWFIFLSCLMGSINTLCVDSADIDPTTPPLLSKNLQKYFSPALKVLSPPRGLALQHPLITRRNTAQCAP